MQESVCRNKSGEAKFRIAHLPFADIPSQSRLFLDYQADSTSLKQFFPSAVRNISQLDAFVSQVLDNYPSHRSTICDVLVDQSHSFKASARVFENINLLRREQTVAVLTGQQAGVFGGPLYTIHKAITAIKMAENLCTHGIDAVPIFWSATEDHDFAEISETFDIDASGSLQHSKIKSKNDNRPVGDIPVSNEVVSLIEDHFSALAKTEFTSKTKALLLECWSPEFTYGQAFCKFISALFAEYGLIVVDPIDTRLKQLAVPLVTKAIEKTDEIIPALIKRSSQLVQNGYHAQVLITDDHVPLFLIDEKGQRKALKRRPDGKFHVSGDRQEFTTNELTILADNNPEIFSPGVMLRPVVQDYLFPTICYVGGGAEIAYFAQNSEVYSLLERPTTPIFHRQSFTIIESKHCRTLVNFDLDFKDLFAGFDKALPSIIERFVNPSTARLFGDVEENINRELHSLDSELSKIDPTLAANLATRRRKILYHIAALQKKFHRVQSERDEIVNRQLRAAFTELFPRNALQERTIGITTYLNRHGQYFINWLYDAIDLDDNEHRVIYL